MNFMDSPSMRFGHSGCNRVRPNSYEFHGFTDWIESFAFSDVLSNLLA